MAATLEEINEALLHIQTEREAADELLKIERATASSRVRPQDHRRVDHRKKRQRPPMGVSHYNYFE